MSLRVLLADLREIPALVPIGLALRRCSPEGRETLGVLVRERAARHPERVVLRFEHETVTYGGFSKGANMYAHVLGEAGVGRGEPVAVMMENNPAMLMLEAAVAMVGAVGALINTHVVGASLRHVLRVSGARHLFTDRACLPAVVALGDAAGLTVWSEGEPRELPPGVRSLGAACAAAPASERPLADVRGRDIFLYIYTSGTTGYPKPAIVRHSRFMMAGVALSRQLGVGPQDVIYAPLPLYHGESNFVGFSVAVRAGAAFASRRRFSARAFLDDVRRHRATAFVYVGELCRYLLRQPPGPHDRDHQLRLAVGAGLRPDIWRRFQERFGIARIVEMYGATEGNIALLNRTGRVGSVGRPYPFQHRSVRLARYDVERGELVRGLGGFLVECGVGEVGELLGRVGKGPMAYDGYADAPANEGKLVRGAFGPGDCYFRTGDLLRRDRENYFYFVDRAGDTFRWKGENVATQEVAEIVNGSPGVAETNVYGVEVPGCEGRAGMAAVVLEPGASFDARRFAAHVNAHLPSYARPVFVRLAREMDVTGTLKQRKIDFQAEGYDVERVSDPLYVWDDGEATYVPLDAAILAQIRSGRRRV